MAFARTSKRAAGSAATVLLLAKTLLLAKAVFFSWIELLQLSVLKSELLFVSLRVHDVIALKFLSEHIDID